MRPGEIEINVQRRAKTDKLTKLRASARVPGIVYGTTLKENITLSTDLKMLTKYGAHGYENTIFTLKSEDKGLNDLKVLLKEITRHAITRRPVHLDLLALDMNKAVRVYVDLRYEGKAQGISEGGVLETILRQVEVETLPGNIPEFLAIDVSPLGIAETLHVSDIKFPEGVKPISAAELAICTVIVIKEEVIVPVAAAAGTVAATAAEPEVIGKGKKDEKAEGGAAAPAAGAAAPAKAGAAPAKAAAPAKDKK